MLPYALRQSGQKAWAAHPSPAPVASKCVIDGPASAPASASTLPVTCGAGGSLTFEQHWLAATVAELEQLADRRAAAVATAPTATLTASSSSASSAASAFSSLSSHPVLARHSSASDKDALAWFQPQTVPAIYALLAEYASMPLRLTVGNTAAGVVKYYPHAAGDTAAVFIDISRVPELSAITVDAFGVHAGAAVTFAALIDALEAACNDPHQPASLTAAFPALVRHLRRIGSVQIRAAGSWAGNLMLAKTHADFPSDFVTLMVPIVNLIKHQLNVIQIDQQTY